MLFEDRTRAHADHIGQGFERQTTAAVGVLKAVCSSEGYAVKEHMITLGMSDNSACLEATHSQYLHTLLTNQYHIISLLSTASLVLSSEPSRVTKDVVCFHAGDFTYVVQRLQLDLHEPPLSQVLHYTHKRNSNKYCSYIRFNPVI